MVVMLTVAFFVLLVLPSDVPREKTGLHFCRTLAMLVLMTIHDIMKLDILRPSVLGAEFCGYKPGDASQLQMEFFPSKKLAKFFDLSV